MRKQVIFLVSVMLVPGAAAGKAETVRMVSMNQQRI